MAEEIASGKEWLREQERPTEWGVPFTYEGIERSNEPMWSAQIPRRNWEPTSITFSGTQIAESTRGGAFSQAIRDEYMNWARNARYVMGQQWVSWDAVTVDPDMEMDIGL